MFLFPYWSYNRESKEYIGDRTTLYIFFQSTNFTSSLVPTCIILIIFYNNLPNYISETIVYRHETIYFTIKTTMENNKKTPWVEPQTHSLCWTCSWQGGHAPLWQTCVQECWPQLSKAPQTLSHWRTAAWPQRMGWLKRFNLSERNEKSNMLINDIILRNC